MSEQLHQQTTSTKKPKSLWDLKVPQFVEATADGTALGKSFALSRLREHYERHGITTTLVRVESSGVAHHAPLRASDIFIPTESFAQKQRQVGGLASVLEPLFAALARAADDQEAVLLDWAGGHAKNRLFILASTGFSERLKEYRIRGCSVTVTSSVVPRMREATENIRNTAEAAPGLVQKLLLNEHRGPFAFPAGTAAHETYRELLAAANKAVVRFREIGSDAWPTCEEYGLAMSEVASTTPLELAKTINQDPFIAKVVINEVYAWWKLCQQELNREFPLPKPAAKQR